MNDSEPFVEILRPPDGAGEPAAPSTARFPVFIGGPADAASRLAAVKALVVGAGSIGFEFVHHLARWQVAGIAVVDPKKNKPESQLTHGITPEAIGESKAFHAARLAKRLSPRTRVFALEAGFASVPLSFLAGFHVVFMATDHPRPELEVSRACVSLGLLLIHASVFGEGLCGHVSVYSHAGPETPCVACGFTREDWALLNRDTVFSCDGAGAAERVPLAAEQRTMSLSTTCTLTGQLGLVQFVRDRLGLGVPVRDTELEYCAYTHQTVITRLTRNPSCPCPHQLFRRVPAPGRLADCSVRELINASALAPRKHGEVSVEVDDAWYVEREICACGEPQPTRRFDCGHAAPWVHCTRCRRPFLPHPFYRHRPVPAAILGPSIAQPLSSLGAAQARWVVLRRGTDAVLFLNPDQT